MTVYRILNMGKKGMTHITDLKELVVLLESMECPQMLLIHKIKLSTAEYQAIKEKEDGPTETD